MVRRQKGGEKGRGSRFVFYQAVVERQTKTEKRDHDGVGRVRRSDRTAKRV